MEKAMKKGLSDAEAKVDQIMSLLYHAVNDLMESDKIRSNVPASHALNLCRAAEAIAFDLSDLLYAIAEETA